MELTLGLLYAKYCMHSMHLNFHFNVLGSEITEQNYALLKIDCSVQIVL